jgi:hypothetical protein
MFIYEVSVLLLWYGLWNLLDESYKFLSQDKELIGEKYKYWNILILIAGIYLLSKYGKKN